jgi:hypothetical protein
MTRQLLLLRLLLRRKLRTRVLLALSGEHAALAAAGLSKAWVLRQPLLCLGLDFYYLGIELCAGAVDANPRTI